MEGLFFYFSILGLIFALASLYITVRKKGWDFKQPSLVSIVGTIILIGAVILISLHIQMAITLPLLLVGVLLNLVSLVLALKAQPSSK